MFRITTFITVLSYLRFARGNFRTCVPNTQFILNDRMCYCDGKGQWTRASCMPVAHKVCQPGGVVWHGCSQCICQDDGQLLCNMISCPDDPRVTSVKGIQSIGPWCIPFRIYYVDCNICVCPESARTANIRCAKDPTCTALRTPSISDLLTSKTNSCKPKVLYLLSCLQCVCSDEGFFVISNCVETCSFKPNTELLPRTCTPHSFYRNDCNVCRCPSNGILTGASCTQAVCDGEYRFKALESLRSETKMCTAHQFTPPQCLYCHCNPEGTVDQEACLKLDCLKTLSSEYDVVRSSCSPGDMVPVCTECFCLGNGTTRDEYCTRGCSYSKKIEILEKVIKDSRNIKLVNWADLTTNLDALNCAPNSIYTENGKFCLCPDSQSKEKTCIVASKTGFDFQNPASQFGFKEAKISIDFNSSCTPSTFVEFDCNTCFCSKVGRIDPKWCTYDDCDAIQLIKDAQKARSVTTEHPPDHCTPGSIMEQGCNFCICPENGQRKDSSCTKNSCSEVREVGRDFDCDPFEYYEIDCNVCLCPRDGKKNVAKCSKNVCEDNFLRSDGCVSGTLFSDRCNICVCPSDGNKENKVCTNHNCKNSSWRNIFRFANRIMADLPDDSSTAVNKLDLCFPGEEFIDGHKFCVCPEMGLKSYATCNMLLGEDRISSNDTDTDRKYQFEANRNMTLGVGDSFTARRQMAPAEYLIYNVTMATGSNCTPGSTYIKGCQQCICPSEVEGDKGEEERSEYCRPLNSTQCALSGVVNLPTGNSNSTMLKKIALAPHNHTRYYTRGTEKDRCHLCEREQDGSIIREHCFKSVAVECAGVEPTFLKDKILMN